MNKFVANVIKVGALGAALLACVPFANARDNVSWSVSVGSGGYSPPPVVYSPAPVYYPPPVVYSPPVVTHYYQPAPVVTYPSGYVYYSNSTTYYPNYYYRGHHHHHHHGYSR